MKKPLIWIHGDCLNPLSPALSKHSEAPRTFVFDIELLSTYRISLKRVAFLYECLLEIPGIEIRKGDVAVELAQAVSEYDCDSIVAMETVAPRFALIVERLKREFGLSVEIMKAESFAGIDANEKFDLKRFSRFWEKVKARALSLNRSFDW